MQRLIFMNDILFHSPENLPTWHSWLAEILNPAVDLACNHKIILFPEIKNKENNIFNREKFYELSNIHDVPLSYYPYKIDNITQKSWNYLFSFINKEDLIIGIELGLDLRRKLTKEGITFINFWFHSFKLFDDICFMLNTNNESLFERIKKYQIPSQKFNLYTALTKIKLLPKVSNLSIEDNCCLFIGQTMTDRSIEKDGKFLNITDYSQEMDSLAKKYSKIYYIPHPFAPVEKCPEVLNFIEERPFIEVISNIPTYILLSSDKVKKVVGLSSSVLYEANFFGKEIEYLYQPLFDIDAAYAENTYISVYNDYLDPGFWIEVLAGYFHVNKDKASIKLFDHRQSVLRGEVLKNWHGYRLLDNYVSLADRIEKIESLCNSKLPDSFTQEPETAVKISKMQELIEVSYQILSNKIRHLEKQPSFYKQIKKYNKVTHYLLGIPVFRRNNKKIYILGICIWNPKWKSQIYSFESDGTTFYKNLRILGWSKKLKNYSLDSGERQIATNISDIRKDHFYRYECAINYIKNRLGNKKTNGLDIFCGNGYGSYMITQALQNTSLVSYDACKEAINLAKKFYKTDRNTYRCKLFPFKLRKEFYNYAISLESIEHLEKDKLFLKTLSKSLKSGGILVISTPNCHKYSLSANVNHFHYRHYDNKDFIKLLDRFGFAFDKLYGQDTYILDSNGKISGLLPEEKMILREGYDGQFTIYIAHKK